MVAERERGSPEFGEASSLAEARHADDAGRVLRPKNKILAAVRSHF